MQPALRGGGNADGEDLRRQKGLELLTIWALGLYLPRRAFLAHKCGRDLLSTSALSQYFAPLLRAAEVTGRVGIGLTKCDFYIHDHINLLAQAACHPTAALWLTRNI